MKELPNSTFALPPVARPQIIRGHFVQAVKLSFPILFKGLPLANSPSAGPSIKTRFGRLSV